MAVSHARRLAARQLAAMNYRAENDMVWYRHGNQVRRNTSPW